MPTPNPGPEVPPRPAPPEADECCMSDCGSACVFERYARELERWEALTSPSDATRDPVR
jgi:hypothetical protein